ncbi:MAG: radical SAM protein [Thermodesulfobacteriota bacterium]|nr:radical SAM protein [Thermodesulfobacteriota bacterium]
MLLISANTEMINMPVLPLGLGCIARATQEAGHEVMTINLMDQEETLKALGESISEFKPDIIGISVRNIDDQVMNPARFLLEPVKSMITFCRQHTDSPIVMGGAGYSIFPQSVLEYLEADIGIQGEGEHAFVLLLERLQKKSDLSGIPGLYLPKKGLQGKRKFSRELDDFPIPLPEAHLWAPSNFKRQEIWLPFQTRRGCPMNCSYCSTALIEGTAMRTRDPSHAVKMLSKYVEAGFDRFFFVDNIFNVPLLYAKSLCDRIMKEELNITWRCILYPWKVDQELVEKMAAAGCTEISLGFESGSPEMLQNMNKRYSPEEVQKISETFKKYKINQMGFLLLGGPGENKKTVQESLEFADSLDLESMKVTAGIRIYPNTSLSQQARKEGLILSNDNLLLPTFYVSKDLRSCLQEMVSEWLQDRSNWFQ